jgi:hypothetical protein
VSLCGADVRASAPRGVIRTMTTEPPKGGSSTSSSGRPAFRQLSGSCQEGGQDMSWTIEDAAEGDMIVNVDGSDRDDD